MLKATTISKIHQNLFKYWFTFLHFALDDTVKRTKVSFKNIEFSQYHAVWLSLQLISVHFCIMLYHEFQLLLSISPKKNPQTFQPTTKP